MWHLLCNNFSWFYGNFAKSNFHDIQEELKQLEYQYTEATTASFPIAAYSWPDVSHPVFSSLPPKERLLKLRHALQKLSYLNSITKHWGIATTIQPECQHPLGYTFALPPNSGNCVESINTNLLPPPLPRDYNYQHPGPSPGTRVPFEFELGSNTAKTYASPQLRPPCINMDIVGVPYRQSSVSPAKRHDPFPDPEILSYHQIPNGGKDENRRRRDRTRAGFFCPLPSCCRNQDGVKVPKWIAENPGQVNEAENRARAGLSLRY
ncbi:hypothetical protein EV426DRAFT_576955 [Tirmania nivea]|nr:hypothetical protein EV426DRAFT_576955 [Tirmania nivea]